MSYASFATHSETYVIDGHPIKVTADFVKNRIFIQSTLISEEFGLDEYEAFEGDMREFVMHKINKAA